MRKSLFVLTARALLACYAAFGMPQHELRGPSYSQQATAIWENIWIEKQPTGTIRIPSPDDMKAVTATYDMKADLLQLTVAAGGKQFKVKLEGGVGSELAWSPDSEAFFVTWSTAGLTGEYHTLVVYVSEQGLRKVHLDLAARRAFGHPVPCIGPTLVNVVGVAWLEGSQRMLVAAQVPPLNICDSYNTFRAYEVSLPAAVVIKPYGQLAAKKKFWTYLGRDLRDAPDNCITDLKSCESPENHPSPP